MKNEDDEEFAKLGKPAPLYDVEALTRAPTGHDDPEVVLAKQLARASASLWVEASPASRRWWRGYSQTNGGRMEGLLEVATGLNDLERRYRQGGGLLGVDWLAELRKAA